MKHGRVTSVNHGRAITYLTLCNESRVTTPDLGGGKGLEKFLRSAIRGNDSLERRVIVEGWVKYCRVKGVSIVDRAGKGLKRGRRSAISRLNRRGSRELTIGRVNFVEKSAQMALFFARFAHDSGAKGWKPAAFLTRNLGKGYAKRFP
ncbi:hypothetical protein K0M31_003388 [Melipona bicolor]|uniref:Uncharacterized protein n=1 Tax=Melipona bicolor TaxID=60889 RepID=A0AA40FYN1_9HYME|nr:hypothetical protein K0M31_003388 [Melipona bicolor]